MNACRAGENPEDGDCSLVLEAASVDGEPLVGEVAGVVGDDAAHHVGDFVGGAHVSESGGVVELGDGERSGKITRQEGR